VVRRHSLNESGDVKNYDVYWTESGVLEREIPVHMLEAVKQKNHSHEATE